MAGFNNNAQLMGSIPASNTPIVVQIVGSGPRGKEGSSPYIGENGDWYVYDKTTEKFVDTDIKAKGEQGDPGYTPQKGVDYFDGYTPQKNIDYFDGISPTATVSKSGDAATIAITDKDGTTTATVKDGKDGTTPHIGSNGNWFVGSTDTGIEAQGPQGDKGDDYILTDADKQDIAEIAVTDYGDVKSLAERNKRAIDALIELGKGITHRFETVSTDAYSVSVPSGALTSDVLNMGGKSVAFNQKFDGLRNYGASALIFPHSGESITAGHKYYIHFRTDENVSVDGTVSAYVRDGGTNKQSFSARVVEGAKAIKTATYGGKAGADTTTDGNFWWYVYIPNNVGTISDINIFDLTAMFGAGNEPTVEQFDAMFPNEYYPYNTGEIVNADVDEIEVRGKNQFDGSKNTKLGETFLIAKPEVYGFSLNGLYGTPGSRTLTPGMFQGLKIPDTLKGKPITIISVPNDSTEYIFWVGAFSSNGTALNLLSGLNTNNRSGMYVAHTFIPLNDNNYDSFRIVIGFANGVTYNDFKVKIFMCEGTVDDVSLFEPQTISIPTAIRNLPCYGCGANGVYNEVDFEHKQYVQRVAKYTFDGTELGDSFDDYPSARLYKAGLPIAKGYGEAVCNISETLGKTYGEVRTVGRFGLSARNPDTISIVITHEGVNDWRQARDYLNGKTIIYELATPIITDISDILDNRFENIKVEGGGSITFHQSDENYSLPIPNTIDYLVKLSEVTT